MAGHSAWKNIKHRKAAVDAKRGKIWSKLSRAIIVAAKQGGGDPKFNFTLRYAIDDAKAANMPKDTIEKAIKKGTGELEGQTYENVRYEGYGPGGVAIIIDCLTDNLTRTAPEMRMLLDKYGGNLGKPNSVAFGFAAKGVILIDAGKVGEDRLMEIAIEAGAEDVSQSEGGWQVTTEPTEFIAVKDAIEAARIEMVSAELTMVPSMTIAPNVETATKVLKLIDALEDNDDVQKVYHNAELPDEVLAR
jgi:YebC/PmpR family DNA-binding regulatory protein